MSCEICGLKQAEYTCRICGRRVCSEDYDYEEGVCLVCKHALCQICRRQLSIATCKYCRRVACEDCLIQVSLHEYVCVECYRRIHGGRE